MTNVLFVCSMNRLRSPTAEHVFADQPGVETDSAGLDRDAVVRLGTDQLRWADLVVVMEKSHRNKLQRDYKRWLAGTRVICLDIPDDFDYMDLELIEILERRMAPHLPR